MLIDVSIKNYLSFKEKVTFSLLATNNKKEEINNVFRINDNIDILKTSAIYWYNASWKSNLLKAINLIKLLVTESWRLWPNELIDPLVNFTLQPFLLNNESRVSPAEFEINFEINWVLYRYWFSLTNTSIISEQLFCRRTQKEKTLFTRDRQNIKIYDFDDNNSVSRVNENNLALSKFAKEWSDEAKKIHKFFQEIYIFFWDINNLRDTETMMLNEHETFYPFLKSLIQKTDLWISDIDFSLSEILFSELPDSKNLEEDLKLNGIQIPKTVNRPIRNISHPLYDIDNKKIWEQIFWIQNESKWTNKIISLAGSIYNVIRQWKILFIDEIDSSLHPILVENLIYSFNKTNTKKPFQIIFTTQSSHIMNIKKTLRRDQIWFVEKNDYGVSSLKRLSNEKIRKEYITEKNYLKWDFWWLENKKERNNLLNE